MLSGLSSTTRIVAMAATLSLGGAPQGRTPRVRWVALVWCGSVASREPGTGICVVGPCRQHDDGNLRRTCAGAKLIRHPRPVQPRHVPVRDEQAEPMLPSQIECVEDRVATSTL